MSDIVVTKVRAGHTAQGASTLAAWIATNVAASANKLLAIESYEYNGDEYVVAAMATTMTAPSPATVLGAKVYVADFEIEDLGLVNLAAFGNAVGTAGAAPTIASVAGGSITFGATFAKVTLVSATGAESPASAEATLTLAAAHQLVVTSPAAVVGFIGYNVYLSAATGTEKLQNTTPIAFGTNYTQVAALSTGTAAAPAAGALYLREFNVTNVNNQIRGLAVFSN